jgi:hypothetical protein
MVRKAITSCLVTRLDLVDCDVDVAVAALFPKSLRGFLRNDAQFGQGVAGIGFDLEPDAEAGSGAQMATISGRE